MRLLSRGGVIGLVAFRGHTFQGYALRTDDGWVCVACLGMTCSKQKVRTADDCRTMLRATCHAGRFDEFRDIDLLKALIDDLPPHEQPAIMPEQIPGVPVKLSKLNV